MTGAPNHNPAAATTANPRGSRVRAHDRSQRQRLFRCYSTPVIGGAPACLREAVAEGFVDLGRCVTSVHRAGVDGVEGDRLVSEVIGQGASDGGERATRTQPHTPSAGRSHTFGTHLVRQGHDLVVVAVLLGHARLDQTRRYSLPPTQTANAPSTACSPTTDQPQHTQTAGSRRIWVLPLEELPGRPQHRAFLSTFLAGFGSFPVHGPFQRTRRPNLRLGSSMAGTEAHPRSRRRYCGG